ncbi:hypothetical protein [Brevibacillus invocatus]|uniref:hypothetical protein n=1 Tax=Brevibacillus invocatus TaxID=173959 RepID=UPI00203D4478|nr:hypothetical protein [Brevibacillus invocatus]MCM3078764.1 hypothetical protein [Brevibacillus invocatus]MCM3428852.1 hypothetical protein [Brevibacillus invocatus]
MQLGIHEACELNELLMSCTNSIQSMALFMEQAQDPELKDMILRHFSVHVQDYNMKVEFATQATGSLDQLNVPPKCKLISQWLFIAKKRTQIVFWITHHNFSFITHHA